MPHLLTANELTKEYAGRRVVDRLSFSLDPGEIVALVGRSGAGKTTAMRLLAGDAVPDGGQVTAAGATGKPGSAGWAAAVGWCAARPGRPVARSWWWHRSPLVGEYVAVGAWLTPDRVLDLFELGASRHVPVRKLAESVRVRVEIARAVALRPGVLVLDEPFTGLDPAGTAAVSRGLRHLAEAGSAVLLTDHRLDAVLALAHRVLLVADGRVKLDCPVAEFRRHPLAEAEYLAPSVTPQVSEKWGRTSPVLQAVGLAHRSGRRMVIERVDLELREGELSGLIAAQDRTVLLELIAGEAPLTGGAIYLDGRDVTRWPPAARAAAGLGVMWSRPSVIERLTVEANLDFVLDGLPFRPTGKRLSSAERRTLVRESLDAFKLSHVRATVATRLSRGERQRLDLARVLIRRPRVLLLDCPFDRVDPLTAAEMTGQVRGATEGGAAALVTDRSVTDALRRFAHLYQLHYGRIAWSGTAAEMIADPAYRATYGFPDPPVAAPVLPVGEQPPAGAIELQVGDESAQPATDDRYEFDLFVSYNRADRVLVEQLLGLLQPHGLRVWIDVNNLPVGQPFQPIIERAINASRAAAIVIGPNGVGPFMEFEKQVCFQQDVDRRKAGVPTPLVPVLLPGARYTPEELGMIRTYTCADFRAGFDPAEVARLVRGILDSTKGGGRVPAT